MKLLFLNGNVEVLEIPAVDPIYGLIFNVSNYVVSFVYDMNLYTAISYKTTYTFQVIDNLYIDMIK